MSFKKAYSGRQTYRSPASDALTVSLKSSNQWIGASDNALADTTANALAKASVNPPAERAVNPLCYSAALTPRIDAAVTIAAATQLAAPRRRRFGSSERQSSRVRAARGRAAESASGRAAE